VSSSSTGFDNSKHISGPRIRSPFCSPEWATETAARPNGPGSGDGGPRAPGFYLRHRYQSGSHCQAANSSLRKCKNLPEKENRSEFIDENVVQIEHSASSSRSKHEGESSFGLCDRLSRTRDNSQRQLPMDQDYAVSTREYQTDQSSLKTAPTASLKSLICRNS
jgi:hypothetical protein